MSHYCAQLHSQKQSLRNIMRTLRKEAHIQNSDAALAVRDRLFESVPLPPKTVIATTIAQKYEIDTMPLNETLFSLGYKLCLPTVNTATEALIFREWQPGDALTESILKIPEPLPEARKVDPEVVLVPLLAFDRQGNRLGQGGGYYDRTIRSLRSKHKIIAIGLAFSAQEIPCVPTGENDEKLDIIITESDVIRI